MKDRKRKLRHTDRRIPRDIWEQLRDTMIAQGIEPTSENIIKFLEFLRSKDC